MFGKVNNKHLEESINEVYHKLGESSEEIIERMKSLRDGISSNNTLLRHQILDLEKKLDLVIESYVNKVDPEREANEKLEKDRKELLGLRQSYFDEILKATSKTPTPSEVDMAILASGYKFDKELLDE